MTLKVYHIQNGDVNIISCSIRSIEGYKYMESLRLI